MRTTLLAAHALPPEFAGRADDYIDLVCREMLPAVGARGPRRRGRRVLRARSASRRRRRARVFEAARALGLPVKLHADQLSDQGGAALAARIRRAVGRPPRVHERRPASRPWRAPAPWRCCCPARSTALRETQLPPVDALRAHGVPMAVATDCNPGTSPVHVAAADAEHGVHAVRPDAGRGAAGATRHAARALGLADRGTLAVGQARGPRAVGHREPAELAYRIGGEPLRGIVRAGAIVRWSDR